MKTEVRVAPQVQDFVKCRAPEPRQALRKAIKALASEAGALQRGQPFFAVAINRSRDGDQDDTG